MRRLCGNCDFWVDLKLPSQDAGECRGGLPVLVAPGDPAKGSFLNAGVWPWVPAMKWCAAFRERHGLEWKPIETAPKDRRILLFWEGEWIIGRWHEPRYRPAPEPYWRLDAVPDGDSRVYPPTAWCELPPMPQEKKETSE